MAGIDINGAVDINGAGSITNNPGSNGYERGDAERLREK
jgi:hypothetical protein